MMSQEPFFKDMKPFAQLLVFAAIVIFSALLFSLLASVLINLFFGYSFEQVGNLTQMLEVPKAISALKLMQGLSQVGLFVIPPLVFVKLTQKEGIAGFLRLKKTEEPLTLVWAFAGVFTILPLVGILTQWNMSMDLPDSMAGTEEWMKRSEGAAAKITEAFLAVGSVKGLLVNILIIGILPAVGEELLFRGGVQQLFNKMGANKHIAIILTAALFSAFHMQFYGFLPRFALGLSLGYAFYLSGNLWIPILMHFVNNTFSVVAAWLFHKEQIGQNYNEIGMTESIIPILLSLVLTVYVLYRIRTNEKQNRLI